MKGYFGGKEVLQVVLGGKTLYKKSSEVELPPPETIRVRVASFLTGRIDPSTVPPEEKLLYNAHSTTTDWIEVRPNSAYEISTYLTNKCVIQLKNSEGEITTWTEDDGNYRANDVVFNTGNNTLARIYFYQGTNSRSHRDLYLKEQRD